MILETPRLILRELLPSDAPSLFLLDSNTEVMKFVGQPTLSKVSETEEVINFIRNQYQKFGVGRLAVIEKSTNLLIGWSGIKFIDYPINGFQNIYELGYRFRPDFWGKGYATESAKAALDYGFNVIKTEVIYAYCDANNKASINTLKKLGFLEKNQFTDQGDLCIWFELNKSNFKN